MKMIVCCDMYGAIGLRGGLLCRIPLDHKMFYERTQGKILVMGRRTFESLPQRHGLTGRINLVLSHKPHFKASGAEVYGDIPSLLSRIEELKEKGFGEEDVFCIGGGEVYRQFLPMCDEIFMTRVFYAYEADTHFPELKKEDGWHMAEESDELTCFDQIFTFQRYVRLTEEKNTIG